MIRLVDGWTLAMTKLRTRKLRTIVTAVIASLLFAGIVAAFSMTQGVLQSYARFSKNSLTTRYIVQGSYFSDLGIDYGSTELIVKAKERNEEVIEQKKADAKRLGLSYDPAQEQPVTTLDSTDGRDYLNSSNTATRQVIQEAYQAKEEPFSIIKKRAEHYNLRAAYMARPIGDTENVKLMQNGKEDLGSAAKNARQPSEVSTDTTLRLLNYFPKTIVDMYILKNADVTPVTSSDAAIPVIAPFNAVEKALGLSALPGTATSAERLARIDEVKRRANGVTITACYRNSASQQLLETARQQAAEKEAKKNDKSYIAPSVIYGLPDASTCGPAVVTADTRTSDQKTHDAKQREFDLKYQTITEPVQKKLTLRVIGVSPSEPNYNSMSTLEMLSMSVGGASLGGVWAIPEELVNQSVRDSIIPQAGADNIGNQVINKLNLYEFATADDAKNFVEQENCNGMNCVRKPMLFYYGSNSVLLDNLKENATKVLGIAGLVVAAVAAVIMMGMIGRVIADSRRETAVFRAIGAKRNDIRLIYTVYVLAFSFIIALLAIGLGLGVAAIISSTQEASLTVSARLMFIETTETSPFQLVALWPEALLVTVGAVLLTGFVAMQLPLARNLVRSPLKDMRDE